MSTIQPIRIEDVAAKTLVGHHKRYTMETKAEIPALWQGFVPHIGTIPNMVGHETYGVMWDVWTKGQYFEYMAAIEVSSADSPSDGLETLQLPAMKVAVFEHTGPLSNLPTTIAAIFHEWVPGSGANVAGFPNIIEVYGEKFDPETASGTIELWVPLV